MKKLLTLIAMIAFCLSTNAQMILSEQHAMLRVNAQHRYLLLPVQEKEENANIHCWQQRLPVVQYSSGR